MSQVVINDVPPYTQALVPSGGQSVFSCNWTANYFSDVIAYQTPSGTLPNDYTQILSYPSQYSVAFVGPDLAVQVTLTTPANYGDIVTITRMTPADRMNLYTNTNFQPTMLNNDFGILTLVDQQAQLVNEFIAPRYNYSATINNNTYGGTVDSILPILPPNHFWVKNNANTAIVPSLLPTGGFAPADATYITLTDWTAELPNSLPLSSLSSGIMVSDAVTNTIYTREILGTSNQIVINNANGVIGNIGLSIADNPYLPGNAGVAIPQGTTAQRIVPTFGISLRYNTDSNYLEFWDGAWYQLYDSSLSFVSIQQLQNQEFTYAIDTGIANNYVIALETPLVTLVDGQQVEFVALNNNTTASTLTVDSQPTLPLVTNGNNALTSGAVLASAYYIASYSEIYNSWILVNPSNTGFGFFLPLAGGTMSGVINMGGNAISNIQTLKDVNNNTVLSLGSTSSAVNYIQISNEATGGGTSIAAMGSDSVIGIALYVKHSQVVLYDSTNTQAPILTWTNAAGTEYTAFKCADAQASSVLFTLPAADGSNGQVITTDGSGNLSFQSVSNITPTEVQEWQFNQGYDTGIANAYQTTLSPAVSSLQDGQVVELLSALNANTAGTMTLNVNGSNIEVVSTGLDNLFLGGEIVPTNNYIFVYSLHNNWFVLQNSSLTSAGLFLPLAGGTMSGVINMGGYAISNIQTLKDVNNNIVLSLGSTSSAVNYVKIINSATGNPVLIDSTGSDSSVIMNFRTKNGNFYFSDSTGTIAPTLMWFDVAGTKSVGFKAPDTLANNTVYTYPAAYPGSNGYVLSSTTAGVMSWVANGAGASYLPLSGGTMSGVINMGGNAISNIPDITDASGNIIFSFATSGTPVNYLQSMSGVTGSGAGLAATGTDSSVAMALYNKNSAFFFQDSTHTVGATIYLNSAAGTHSVGLASPTTLSGSTTYTLPGAYPVTSGYVLSSTTAGITSWVANGGGGGGTSTPTANTVSEWDGNVNFSSNSFIGGYATTATAASTTTLTVTSAQNQYFTGTTTQTVLLPVTSTLVLGQSYNVVNNSTGIVSVQSSGGNTVQAMAAGTTATFTCILLTGTTAASWSVTYIAVGTGTSTPTANTISKWDSNTNMSANNFINGYATHVNSGGTTSISANSGFYQFFTGSTSQSINLPLASNLVVGQSYFIVNNSTSFLGVNTSAGGAHPVAMVPTNSFGIFTCILASGTTAASWSYIVLPSTAWDANRNFTANGFISGYATTATTAGTTTLTVSSAQDQYFTGTTTQTVLLPVTSTLALGQSYTVVNNSTGIVTVESSGGNTVQAMAPGATATFTCISLTGTSAASWSVTYVPVIGTVIFSQVLLTSAISLTTGVVSDITSITLPVAGTWLLRGNYSIQGSTNITDCNGWINFLSMTPPDQSLLAGIDLGGVTLINIFSGTVIQQTITAVSGDTWYLSCLADFPTSTATACGYIEAVLIG